MYKKYCRTVKRESYNESNSIFNITLIGESIMEVKDLDTNDTFKYNFNFNTDTGILTILDVDIKNILVYTK